MSNYLLDEKIDSLVKRDNNFDFIRYFFAFSLVIVHFCTLTNTEQFWFVSGGTRVKAFFILSGFLVFNSYNKKPNLKNYIEKRIRRILPAYVFIVVLCVIMGTFLTSIPVKEYFHSVETYKYILANLSFLNFIEPSLPGVFENNPIHAVNGSLWTMKVEVLFYISIPIVFYLLKHYNKLIIMIMIFLLSIFYNELFQYLFEQTNNELYQMIKRQIGSQFIYFYSGTFVLLYFDYFCKYLKYLFPLAILIYLFKDYNKITYYMESICFAVIIIGFAYHFKYLNFIRKYDNISYGIYLYHFPIIQIIVHYGLPQINLFLSFFIALLSTVLLSLFSWHLIEKPIINKSWKRKKVS